MYRNEFPEVGDIVMCKVFEVGDAGSYVNLLEYKELVGMIGITQYSRQRIRNIRKLVNEGKVMPAQVLTVDKINKCIDLSKAMVKANDIDACEYRYERSKRVHYLVKRVAELAFPEQPLEQAMNELYTKFVWKWQEERCTIENSLHVEDIIKSMLKSNDKTSYFGPDVSSELVDCFVQQAHKVFQQKPINVTGIASIICFGPEGIDATKTVIKQVKQNYPRLQVNYISESHYMFHCMTDDEHDQHTTVQMINEAINQAIMLIKTFEGGDGAVKEYAKSSDKDMKDNIARKLEEMQIGSTTTPLSSPELSSDDQEDDE